jgi:thiamine pyrophosphate-dependent acetolactate synthase large subunit-like protein
VDLAKAALACGFRSARVVRTKAGFAAAKAMLLKKRGPVLAQIKVAAEKLPLALPPREGALLKSRFRSALLGDAADAE